MCMCMDVYGIFMVANLILLYSFKTYLSFLNLKITLQENMGYLIHLFFSGRHQSTHCFRYLGHLSIFSILLFFSLYMNNFCIATCIFSATKLLRDSNKKLEHLFGIYPIGHIFGCLLPV
jgi:hypothetical protein